MSLPRTIALKPQQRNVALLSALLYSVADIAAETGYSVQYINQLLRRSDVRDLVKQYEHDRMAQQKAQVLDELMEDAPTNLRVIKQLRDDNTKVDEKGVPVGDHRVALSAATLLFDRQVPKITKHEEEKHIHIHLSREEQALGASVLDEERLIDVEESAYAVGDD